jgi:DNA-binding transcriptional ArsR family regulator
MLAAAPDPAAVLAAIASPRRREILRLTWDEECGAGDLARAMPDVSWGAVSLQVRALVEAGLLRTRTDGRFRYYRADRPRLGPVAAWLERMWDDALWKLKLAAELEATRRGPKPGRGRRSRSSSTRSPKRTAS